MAVPTPAEAETLGATAGELSRKLSAADRRFWRWAVIVFSLVEAAVLIPVVLSRLLG